jgi:flavin-dependent dehydrogenase
MEPEGRTYMIERSQSGKPRVVVVGGGYGGVAVAKAVDATSDVVLVEPKDAFMHNIAALRALVDPSWLSSIFLPYRGLLASGRVVRDRAVVVGPHRVVTASGEVEIAGAGNHRGDEGPRDRGRSIEGALRNRPRNRGRRRG